MVRTVGLARQKNACVLQTQQACGLSGNSMGHTYQWPLVSAFAAFFVQVGGGLEALPGTDSPSKHCCRDTYKQLLLRWHCSQEGGSCSGLLVMLSGTHLQGCHGGGQLRSLHVCPGVKLLAEGDECHKGSNANVQGAWRPGGEWEPEAAERHSGNEDLHRYRAVKKSISIRS